MSPRPQLPPEEIAARRAAILASAIDRIAESGLESVRIKDVAAGAEVSVGSVQYYFATREDLLVAALSAHSRSVVEAIAALAHAQGSAWERLRETFRAVPAVGSHERRSVIWVELVVAARRSAYLRTTVAEVFAHWRDHLTGLIVAGIDDGSLTPRLNVETIVDTLIAQIDGFDLALASGRVDLDPGRVAASLEATAAALLGVRAH
ncbi:TetR family transcriptional regulator [Brevibacterium sanguinis]|uniref:TetR family transcriptional regulator n=2 Tax=Brevibacterium TaxID=1696 RepID=A0A366INS8_9MICO|nr:MULTISPECIES: TetR/AcrR family transcriptional regulator [Brevibacterium]RBP67865.1 TetR family transcriptional regulator [Brevibacterium sanguinis]RBP74718.1 TetR family transcriptional regulator [Brevibacterium celere]